MSREHRGVQCDVDRLARRRSSVEADHAVLDSQPAG
jgi:hypothetical protein